MGWLVIDQVYAIAPGTSVQLFELPMHHHGFAFTVDKFNMQSSPPNDDGKNWSLILTLAC
jgi:hypothetical protein